MTFHQSPFDQPQSPPRIVEGVRRSLRRTPARFASSPAVSPLRALVVFAGHLVGATLILASLGGLFVAGAK